MHEDHDELVYYNFSGSKYNCYNRSEQDYSSELGADDYDALIAPNASNAYDSTGYTALTRDLLGGGILVQEKDGTNVEASTPYSVTAPSFCFSKETKFDSEDSSWTSCVDDIIERLHNPPPNTTPTTSTTSTIPTSDLQPLAPVPPLDLPTTDWNGRFQTALELPMTTPTLEAARAQTICDVCQEFRQEVTTIAKIIIEEVHTTDPTQKKIPPSKDVGGQAGGEKFIHNHVLYKFARDWRGIYAGHEGAMKAAGCELRGLHAIAGAGIAKLRVPMCNLIDFQGWRIVAVAFLPIDDATLVYGSSDCGNTVRTSDPEINVLMRELGVSLNVAEHQVRCRRPPHTVVQVSGPADLEVHRGRDGRVYCLDAARMMVQFKVEGVVWCCLVVLFRCCVFFSPWSPCTILLFRSLLCFLLLYSHHRIQWPHENQIPR